MNKLSFRDRFCQVLWHLKWIRTSVLSCVWGIQKKINFAWEERCILMYYGAAVSVTVTLLRNGIGDPGSNPRRTFIRFITREWLRKTYQSICSSPSYVYIVRQTTLFSFCKRIILGEGIFRIQTSVTPLSLDLVSYVERWRDWVNSVETCIFLKNEIFDIFFFFRYEISLYDIHWVL